MLTSTELREIEARSDIPRLLAHIRELEAAANIVVITIEKFLALSPRCEVCQRGMDGENPQCEQGKGNNP